MNKILNYAYLLMIIMVGLCVTSCNSDDDDKEQSGKDSSIVGTWRSDFSTGYTLYIFSKDGTGVEKEYDEEHVSVDYFSYDYAPSLQVIKLVYYDAEEGYEDVILSIVSFSKDLLVVKDSDGDLLTLVRQ